MDIICVTNKKIAEDNFIDFYTQIERIAQATPQKIILREKDLSEGEYEFIAGRCFDICRKYNVCFAVNKFINAARNLNIKNIHLSLDDFLENKKELNFFDGVGVSVHSAEEAAEAERNGADYIVAGHIFHTDCKKGLPPRGIGFLEEVLRNVSVPVYAIGGITDKNVSEVKKTYVSGVCLMSSLMKSENPKDFLKSMREMLI